MKNKFKEGETVFCNGLIAKVDKVSTIAGTNRPLYSLVSIEDEELTCSVPEEEVEKYNGEEVDQTQALNEAYFESRMVAYQVDSITDKYYGDK